MIINSKHSAIKVMMNLVYILRRNMQIIADKIHVNTKLLKLFGNDPNMIEPGIFYGDVTLCHCCKANKRSHFDHIRQHAMFSSSKVVHTFYVQKITPDPFDLRSHLV